MEKLIKAISQKIGNEDVGPIISQYVMSCRKCYRNKIKEKGLCTICLNHTDKLKTLCEYRKKTYVYYQWNKGNPYYFSGELYDFLKCYEPTEASEDFKRHLKTTFVPTLCGCGNLCPFPCHYCQICLGKILNGDMKPKSKLYYLFQKIKNIVSGLIKSF